MNVIAGVDIGGTKCSVCLGKIGDEFYLIDKIKFPTPSNPIEALRKIISNLKELLTKHSCSLKAIGISCGGPLDSQKGIILSPPNLIGWNKIDVITPLKEAFSVPVRLQNDANACALAEWKWGAGKGYQNIVFLTFGTGMGAGLILNGKLYSGTNDMAGEIGHIRIEKSGPIGYGKAGSFEGFCSGGGIKQLARKIAEKEIKKGNYPLFCPSKNELDHITAEKVGYALQQGDPIAKKVFTISGKKLGRGLAILIDILNPERIIIGSIYHRQRPFLEPIVLEELKKEALHQSLVNCKIVPASLGEYIGDAASLSIAMDLIDSSSI
jgi:glucokinase